MEMPTSSVVIHYHRPPDRTDRYEQLVIAETSQWTATYMPSVALSRPVMAGDRMILEPGAPVIWFSYPGMWHDIGRFHLANGEFTGVYANILTPVEMDGNRWETTDLCLDVWLGSDGAVELLDEEDLAEAERQGWIEEALARKAREHAAELMFDAARGVWPPEHVYEWTLERVRRRLNQSSDSTTAAETSRSRSK